jgi:hypothetical protein
MQIYTNQKQDERGFVCAYKKSVFKDITYLMYMIMHDLIERAVFYLLVMPTNRLIVMHM